MIIGIVVSVIIGILLGELIKILFEVRVKQFQDAIRVWIGIEKTGAIVTPQPHLLLLIEQLAAIEHEQWVQWTKHMLDNFTPENIERWNYQILTPYADFSEKEKESDRKWARKIIAILDSTSRGDVSNPKDILLAFRDWWHWYISEYGVNPDTGSVMMTLASLLDFPEGFIKVQEQQKILREFRTRGEKI